MTVTMMPSGGGELSIQGAFTDTQSIPAASTYQTVVPLGSAVYTKGYLTMRDGTPPGSPVTSAAGKTAFIMFTTTTSDAMGHATDRNTQVLSTYLFYEWRQVGFSRSVDGRLSNRDWGAGGRIRIEECYISGSDLIIEWRNWLASGDTIDVAGRYHVFE